MKKFLRDSWAALFQMLVILRADLYMLGGCLILQEGFGGKVSSSYSISSWILILVAAPIVLLALFIYAFVNVRRTSKIKI